MHINEAVWKLSSTFQWHFVFHYNIHNKEFWEGNKNLLLPCRKHVYLQSSLTAKTINAFAIIYVQVCASSITWTHVACMMVFRQVAPNNSTCLRAKTPNPLKCGYSLFDYKSCGWGTTGHVICICISTSCLLTRLMLPSVGKVVIFVHRVLAYMLLTC